MSDRKEVKFDVDGYEAVTSALKELLNQFPLLDGNKITFSSLKENNGISFFPISGAVVETQKKTITGKIYEVCQYPFFIVYRASGLSESRKAKIKFTDFECNLLVNGMNEFRNLLLAEGLRTTILW